MKITHLDSGSLAGVDERVATPTYDRTQVATGIAHFGVGGFHRSHQAMYLDRLLDKGEAFDWGICGIGLMPSDQVMSDVLSRQDNLYTLLTRATDGQREARVIGSIVRHLYAPGQPDDVLDVLVDERTRIVSLTITEGGYNLDPVTGRFDPTAPDVARDLRREPGEAPRTVFGYVIEALRRRWDAGRAPFTIMSCDNIQSNGGIARAAFSAFASLVDAELGERVRTEVAFPSSMVDRITPITTPADIAELTEDYGIDDAWPVVCEPYTQWVLEDAFPAGRPPWETVGVQLTDDVEPYELMKLRLLNAGHQAIAYAGHLAGHTYVHEAARDTQLAEFLLGYMTHEAVPTLKPVPGIDLDVYIHSLIERFANPFIRDTIARLCAFTSDRIPKFLLPVINKNLADGGEFARSAAVVACWARYAEGVDESGAPIEVQDALRDELVARARQQYENPLAFIENESLFGALARNPEFADRYRSTLASLHLLGTRRTIQNLNSSLAEDQAQRLGTRFGS
ncbi:mannitol dehydrogenase family protein [Streptomyces sp. NPDC058470]|uniref:mannitol dehydrogenase family protein n=1 Tax=Streptomyces sp. NPDC058470 TaxID=3346515 RepID=UPI0036555C42